MALKLHYFDGYGRMEPIRQLLVHAKVEFEEVKYSFESFAASKALFEWGQVPAIEFDGVIYCQTQAMFRFLGNKHGLYPTDASQAYRVDSLIDAISDLGQ
jgi:glutathione S-transferase